MELPEAWPCASIRALPILHLVEQRQRLFDIVEPLQERIAPPGFDLEAISISTGGMNGSRQQVDDGLVIIARALFGFVRNALDALGGQSDRQQPPLEALVVEGFAKALGDHDADNASQQKTAERRVGKWVE